MLNICSIISLVCAVDQVEFNISAASQNMRNKTMYLSSMIITL